MTSGHRDARVTIPGDAKPGEVAELAEGTGLLNRRVGINLLRGFESLPLRRFFGIELGEDTLKWYRVPREFEMLLAIGGSPVGARGDGRMENSVSSSLVVRIEDP
jgi:hypothetical protein